VSNAKKDVLGLKIFVYSYSSIILMDVYHWWWSASNWKKWNKVARNGFQFWCDFRFSFSPLCVENP